MSSCLALIVAAGRGTRLGGSVPKQYRTVAGEPMLRRTVSAFLRHPLVDAVRVVIDPAHRELCDQALARLNLPPPIAGGGSRQESVRLGLEACAARAPRTVLIHDGARPLVDAGTIDRVCLALEESPGAIAALPLTDTVKREQGGFSAGTIDRSGLWRAQTPQGFHFADILAAHRACAGEELTDDAAVAEHCMLPVALVAGDPENIKVTTEDDLHRAERLIAAAGETRVGQGFDVHRLGDGDGLILCGLHVPHDQSLIGHSDADVGLHALTDALLGAIGAGDIGQHFPPSDPQWRGADSGLFVRHAVALIGERAGKITNVDVTLLCERPKIAPVRAAMRGRVATLLEIPDDRVNVKATTTEGLGFLGRGEGIAALATATVRLRA